MKIPIEDCRPSAPPLDDPYAPPPPYNPQYGCFSETEIPLDRSLKYITSEPLCTGVLVSESFVITSAYCASESMKMVDEKAGNFLKVRIKDFEAISHRPDRLLQERKVWMDPTKSG